MQDLRKRQNTVSCANQGSVKTQEEKNVKLVIEGKLSLRELEQLGGSLPSSFVNSSTYFALQASSQLK
ncbi:hypothetical protein Wcon_00914 [Wolbachia endosymbiont of Cylisticus convexus]|uniref:hypothetical protein n=1 Tax=Wolbachia endosymbiont of Cylisticus convexus TaxID=118728 RepID=UPI000DF67CE1|nr:hypothetical protein [Wolbachia endosymbiont of Cylisticus convexus]RDD34951.1 hypothetical protein Wcon_00914 [Wolbachia endosymbiont of Cylisticus convexus]